MDKRDDLKYCPQCGAEHLPEFETCAECETPLVFGRDLPQTAESGDHPVGDEEDFIVVVEGIGEIQKDLITAALEQERIPYYVSGDRFSTVQLYWSLESKLWVPETYAEKARAIIGPLLEDHPLDEPDDEEE